MILKSAIHYTFLLSAIFTATFLTTGCAQKKSYRIGVAQCSDDAWRSKMNDEMKREVMFHDDVTIEIRSADDNSRKQIDDLKYFVDNDFDLIITSPNEADSLTPIISEIHASGRPIIVFDRNINGGHYTAFQGADNYGIARKAAAYARNLVKGECNVIEITGLCKSTPAADRSRGFGDVVAETPGMTLLGSGEGNWNDIMASKVADSLLTLFPQTNLIYAHNDRMAIAAAKVARGMGRDDIKVIGIDAAPTIGMKAVNEGLIDATFLYPTEGHKIIRTAMAILKGEPYERVKLFHGTSAVDKSNAEILQLQDKALTDETDKIIEMKAKVDDYWDKHSLQTTLLYAAAAIAVLLFVVVFAIMRAYWNRRRHQEELAVQNARLATQRDQLVDLNKQLEEATASKLSFFTNVSHDLRTPLTLIAEPIAQISEADNLTPSQHTLMKLANKNVKILMRLINQILDFRKYEDGKLTTALTDRDLSQLIDEWSESFKPTAHKRNLKFTVEHEAGTDFSIALDVEKMERVYFNLISNAFKYTPDNGTVTIGLSRRDNEIILSVRDTGCGITAEDMTHIFENFFRVDKAHPNGSGIGLSLTKAFVELHGGRITAESQPGKGSTFTVTLPVRHTGAASAGTSPTSPQQPHIEIEKIDNVTVGDNDDKPCLLVIDDNPDIVTLITEILSDEYNVISASDGARGVKLASKYIPDIVVCDMMMPVMDGLECCRRLKEEMSTSHIPVLMLTACSLDEQRVQGYECGADGYLSKPFKSAVLKARCHSLIANRSLIKNLFAPALSPAMPTTQSTRPTAMSNSVVSNIDSDFYNRFCGLVEKDMGNPDLNVDDLASRMGLGRSQLYRKIKALTNYSPVELIRGMRLKKARTLLTSTERTVSEIAYEVGFSSPAYFTKCYRDQYGETPSEAQQRTSKPRQ